MSGAEGGCTANVTFAIRDVRRRERHPGPWDTLLGIVGAVDVRSDADLLVTLPEIPVIELAQELDRWLISLPPEGADFVYTSRQARDEPGLIYVRRAGLCWRIGSIWAQEEREIETSLRRVAAAAGDYVADVARQVRPLGVDLPRFLRGSTR